MTGEQVPAGALKDGDVIHIPLHQHDPSLGQCRIGRHECDVEVCGCPQAAGDDHNGTVLVAVRWCAHAAFLGASDAVTGVVVYEAKEPVLCIGHAGTCAA